MSNNGKKTITILIVDDDESIRSTFKPILQRNGYEVDTAETGREAIEKSKKNSYDFALIDIILPDMDGTDLLTEIQEGSGKSGSLHNATKIIVSGLPPSTQSKTKALERGADAYLIKPVKTADILSIIEEKLRNKKPKKTQSKPTS